MQIMDANYNWCLVLYILFTCFSVNSYLSLALVTISANHSLSGDQTISSEQGKFVLGFFNPGNSSNYYIGIWFNTASEQKVAWVANRDKPVSDKHTSILRISNGNLILLDENGDAVWSTSLSSTTSSSSTEAVLLDDGNLVLRDGSISSEPLWQSFDHLSDTWLPGMRIGFNKITRKGTRLTSWKTKDDPAPGLFSLELDPNGTSQFFILHNRSQIMWTSGTWNGQNFMLIPEMRLNRVYNFVFSYNENESYLTYSLQDASFISRYLINVDGSMQQWFWSNSAKEWSLSWSESREGCDVYAYCGGFGICNGRIQPNCQCLSGFNPRSVNEWKSGNYSLGCIRKTSLHCGNNGKRDRFLASQNMAFSLDPSTPPITNAQECETTCLLNCSCTAYAYDDGSCSFWYGELLNLQQLTENNIGGKTLYVRLGASEFPTSNNIKTIIVPVIAVSIVMLLILAIALSLIFRRRRIRKIDKVSGTKSEINNSIAAGRRQNDAQMVLFSFKSILAATNKFSEENKLGEGGYGPVYKGNLPGDQHVAIKRLSKKSGQGPEEFMNELKLIANLQHKYLVRLLGCCVESEEKILIYEYMPNRSLDKFLFDPSEKAKLVWDKRFKIVEGVAQGLLYIHKFSRLKVIHRDLKASNILLDEAMNPKISDFGMARTFGTDQTEANTNRVVGTYGYMSPEYAFSGQFSEKSDVFSFGVFLLEVVSGRRNTSFHRSGLSLTLLSWAWELWKQGIEAELIDASIKDTCRLEEAIRCIHVGLLCVQEDPVDRPIMSLVLLMLTTDTKPLPLPKEPAFHSRRAADSSSERPNECSDNELTVSLPTGR